MSITFLDTERFTNPGENITEAKDYESAIKMAGLDWTVEPRDTFTLDGNGGYIAIPNSKTIVRTSDNTSLGIVSDHYRPLQNNEAFDIIETIYANSEIEFVSGGSFNRGASTFIQVKTPKRYSILGDDVDCYMVFLNSHDGSGAVKCMIVPNRQACHNTLNFPVKGVKRMVRFSHLGDPKAKLAQAKEIMLEGSTYMEVIAKEIEDLQNTKITFTDVVNLVNRLYPIDDLDNSKPEDMLEIQKRLMRRDQLMTVYNTKDDLLDFGHTAYRYLSAVADYLDHVNAKNTKEGAIRRFITSSVGHKLFDKAYRDILGLGF